MSRLSAKQLMRDALELTERNLGSLIAARHSDAVLMSDWRDVVRRSLGYWAQPRKCICSQCGIRHGGLPISGDF